MQLGDDSTVYRHVPLRTLGLLAWLGTCSPLPQEDPSWPSPEGSASVDLQWQPAWLQLQAQQHAAGAAVIAASAPARRSADNKPRLGDESKPLEEAKEDVVIGIVTLEGQIPQSVQDDVAYCTRRTLASVAAVPTSHISMTVSNEISAGHKNNVVRFHFILLPIKGTGAVTSTAVSQSAVSSGSAAPFLIVLTREMRELDSLSQYYVLGLQFSIRIPVPEVSQMDIWRDKDYGSSGAAGPTTQPPVGSTALPANADDCPLAYNPCNCAALGTCAWRNDPNTGISSCSASTYGTDNVPCAACPVQERCTDDGCSEITDACSCAASFYGCRWNQAGQCQRGSGTSCVACAKQSSCSTAVPHVVSFMPLSGSYVKPHGGSQQIRLGFDRPIQFMGSSQGTAALHCPGPIPISRPRMKIEVNYLILEVGDLHQGSAGTNNARRCDLVIGEGLVSDTYGVPYLGMVAGTYSLDFGDTVAPQVLEFTPKNGQMDVVPIGALVTLTFSEPIELGSAAKAGSLKVRLSRLEEGEVLAFVAELELKPPSVNVENQLLKVDLNGKIESGSHYTLSLPSGAVADREQNAFTGLPPRVYVFKTASEQTVYQHSDQSSGVPLTSLIAVGAGLIVILGLGILIVWWMRLRMASQRKLPLQPPRSNSKSEGVKVMYVNTMGRTPSQRSSLSSMRTTTSHASSTHTEDVPKGQAPVDAFVGATSATTADFDPFYSVSEKPKLKRSGTWAPGMVPTVSQKSDGDRRGGSKEKNEDPFEFARQRQAADDKRRKKEEEGRKQREAKQRWAYARNVAFAQGLNKTHPGATKPPGAAPPAPPKTRQPSPDPGDEKDAFGPRSAGDANWDKVPEDGGRAGSHTSSTSAEAGSPSKKNVPPGEGIPGRPAGSPNGGAARGFCRSATTQIVDENPELRKHKKDVEKRLRDLMDSPIDVRKKALKELMLEYHPDKNSDQHATQIFQFVNGSKEWFLREP